MPIRTPDHRLRVFVSSTLLELAEERKAVSQAIQNLRLAPVMFESGARPHPAQELYQSYLTQSQIFIAVYWQSYGWVAPGAQISGLEDEYNLSAGLPRLIYIKNPAPSRDPALAGLLDRILNDNKSSFTFFSTAQELKELVGNDLALLLTERFEGINHAEKPLIETRQLPPTNVPKPRNSLIDRQKELETARTLLLNDEIALITLTGPGGTGKSRLAIQIGLEMLEAFKDGVYLVRLEPINDPKLVISTIAETLGMRETTGSQPVFQILKAFLHDKQMLLLLDNFEQVVEASPDVAELLEACPGVKAVVTSRAALSLRLERELPVPPLSVPTLQKLADQEGFSQYAAVELFIQRAQAVEPAFTVTNDNAPAIAEICYRLDGLPLAIELAAARIILFTPHELLVRLSHRFDLLRGGTRDLPERQRTLRGTIDWSYNLLNEQERKLFRRLSVFVGGWTLEAVETVCDLDGDLTLELDDALASLINNNLVIRIEDADRQSRFGMLSTIQEYAYERLVESNEASRIHYQHAQYYLKFVKRVEPLIRSAERSRWLHVLLQEFGNIRRVFERASTSGDCVEAGQHILILLGSFWITSGYIIEAHQWCAQVMTVTDETTPADLRAGLLAISGCIAWAQGDHSAAQTKVAESLKLFQNIADQTLEEKHTFALALIVQGLLSSISRDLATAAAMYQKSIVLFAETQDQWYEALALAWLGTIAFYANDRERALALYNRSNRLARQQGDPWCLVPSLMSTAQVAILDGNLARARPILLEAENLLRITGDNWSLSWNLNDLSHIALMEGQLDLAGAYLLEALTLAKNLWNRRALLLLLTGTAVFNAMRSRELQEKPPQDLDVLSLAGRLCGATEPYIHMPGIFTWPNSQKLYEWDITQVKSLMDKNLWEKAYLEGQGTLFDHAIALAIQSLKGYCLS